jgi:hypothetical protein
MKNALLLPLLFLSALAFAQRETIIPASETPVVTPYVSFEDYVNLVNKVKPHRETHLISIDVFQQMLLDSNTLILDTRSDAMFKAKHIKGAIHLNFSDFTQANLERIIPSRATRILIYCNNNFGDDQINFPTKSYSPPPTKNQKEITLALNIPTYINLFGYGYENVYELESLVPTMFFSELFEGTAVE